MSLWVLDTDALTLFQRGQPQVCQHCAQHPPGELAITVISIEEQFLGWYTRLRQGAMLAAFERAWFSLGRQAGLILRFPTQFCKEPEFFD